MAWTAAVTKTEKHHDEIYVTVLYSDGAISFQETYKAVGQPPFEWIQNLCHKTLERLEAASVVEIPTGAVSSPTPPATPPAEDVDLTAFLRNLRKVERIRALLDIGALRATDQQVIDFVAAVRAKLPTYWGQL